MGDEQSDDVAHSCGDSEETVHVAGWRGRWNIPSLKVDIKLAAHFPDNLISIFSNLVGRMPDLLCLKQIPRRDVWPENFNSLPPTKFSVDLVFFSEGSDEKVLDSLLNDAICSDLALKADVGTAELLIFTSFQLPEKNQRLNGKYYFWGLFIGQTAGLLSESENDALVEKYERKTRMSLNSDDQYSGEGKSNSKHSPLIQTLQTCKRGRGVPRDDAWKHSKKLNVSRWTTECKYCGFISKCGGISRLKAHLAGGILRKNLPGCPKVSLEVKQDMAIWFKKWIKTSNIFWAKKSGVTQSDQARKRNRQFDKAWKHAKLLDSRRQKGMCKYCGFVSTSGGISRLKAHLAGVAPRSYVRSCPKVSPEVKQSMAIWFHEWVKTTKLACAKKTQALAAPEKTCTRKRPIDIECDEKRHFDRGDPPTLLKRCSNVSPQVKTLMIECCENKKTPEGKSKEAEGASGSHLTLQEASEEHSLNSDDQSSYVGNSGPTKGSVEHSPLKQTAQGSTKRGIRDDAWKHAKGHPIFKGRTECIYCGFASKFGGISRLKAHLAGGIPTQNLPGCTNVSPEIKHAMAIWFQEWKKTTKVHWVNDPKAPARTLKRARSIEYDVQLEDPNKGCPNKIRSLMSEGSVEKVLPKQTIQETEGTWKPNQTVRGSFDNMTNLRKVLLKLIDEKNNELRQKNAELQKVQIELRQLEKHLALIS